jgi:predicted O-methyltransferase YrrM
MGSRFQRASPDLVSFVRDLTGATTSEVQESISEVASNKEFYKHLEKHRNNFTKRLFSSYGWGIDSTLGTILFTICRKILPDTVIETGVASGVSSSYVLCALNENSHGTLYSIDLPSGRTEQSGWLIPDYLRHRWELIPGRTSEKLLPLLEKLRTIDIFLHDSEHSYQNMLWEFQTAWQCLRTGGILISHNIDWSDAFADFTESTRAKPVILGDTGGIVKI